MEINLKWSLKEQVARFIIDFNSQVKIWISCGWSAQWRTNTCGCPTGHAALGLSPVNAGLAASNLAIFVDLGRHILRLWRHVVKQSKELGSRRFISSSSPLPSHYLMFIFLVSFCPSQPLSFFLSCLFVLCALSLVPIPGSDKIQEIRTSASVFSHVTSHMLLWTLPEDTHTFPWQLLINWTPLPPKCRMATEFPLVVFKHVRNFRVGCAMGG